MALASFLTVSLAGAGSSLGLSAAEIHAVDSFVASQEEPIRSDRPSESLREYRDGRQYGIGKHAKGGPAVVAVLYTMEKGNSWGRFLAAFDRASMRPLASARVGGKGFREADLGEVGADTIELKTTYYSAHDPSCCPTVSGRSFYSVSNSQLLELAAEIDCKVEK